MDQGCSLLLEFRTCTETVNVNACVLPNSIKFWNDVELYVCQLLMPSIKEYKSCFSNARSKFCATKLVHIFTLYQLLLDFSINFLMKQISKLLA
ncbi:unnamed protein product [Thelazia callipaeda]|uniref:Uncharacterized protein n=1 Tax=Thelazia callipaeda TaxID=103827 RepID=A0A0N5D846_THECL|nr:unnamed protein product [Thelazia callipaeda]